MFLGTAKIWWIGMAILFVAGLFFVVSEAGGFLGNGLGILLIIGSILLFAAAPMRYGRDKQKARQPQAAAPPSVPAAPPPPPRPRASIDARDASEV